VKAEFINPILESTINVIETMASTKVVMGKASLKKGIRVWGLVNGIIGMASQDLAGNLILSFDKESILGIVSSMLGEKMTDITPDVVDAVGELTNMICGGAKAILGKIGYKFDMATPVMLVGQELELCQFSKAPVITAPFTVEYGKFVVETNLYSKNAK